LLVITKCESILDAAGGPKDLLASFSLLTINPSSPALQTIYDAGESESILDAARPANKLQPINCQPL